MAKDTGITPVVIDSENIPEIEMVTLFTIDGTEYKIPKELRPNIAVAFLRDIAQVGLDTALARAMIRVMGQEAVDALAACEAVSGDDVARIMSIIEQQLFSTTQAQSGKLRKGRRK